MESTVGVKIIIITNILIVSIGIEVPSKEGNVGNTPGKFALSVHKNKGNKLK